MSVVVLPLQAAHLPAVTTALTDAFADDAGMRAICGSAPEARYRRRLAAWFLATLRLSLATQQPVWVVSVDGMIIGAALLTRPQTPFVCRAWLGWLLAVGIHCSWGAVWRTAHHERQRAAYRPAQAHAVLEFLAVDRDYRGLGYAALLLDAAQRWSATQAVPTGIWLETTRLSNVAFFEHFGYTLMGRLSFEQGDALFLFRAPE
jgi:GNAT superfamily N-acetyltransferase